MNTVQWINSAKWWHFWNPGSGGIGACIFMGILFSLIFFATAWLT